MVQVDMDTTALAELATSVWRLRNKASNGPLERHVRAVVDALTDVGIETRRYDEVAFAPGLKVRVLAFQPTAGLEREQIIETIRPAVYLHGQPVRLAEVIVGTPLTEPEDAAAPTAEEPKGQTR
jgi:hypothetical protein